LSKFNFTKEITKVKENLVGGSVSGKRYIDMWIASEYAVNRARSAEAPLIGCEGGDFFVQTSIWTGGFTRVGAISVTHVMVLFDECRDLMTLAP
jgi:hypothetical protein